MLSTKKLLYKILSVQPKTGTVSTSLSVSANGSAFTNLKTLIDSDLPSGCRCLGVVGFTTSEQNVLPVAMRYYDNGYSLQVKNVSTTTRTAAITIHYLYV